VRELRNVADRFVLGLLGERLTTMTFDGVGACGLPERMEQIERAIIRDELRRYHGDVGRAAIGLSLPKPTLYDKMRRLKVTVEDFRGKAS
jgi:two-component system C4-dicarboxylate transport response regulator DctD